MRRRPYAALHKSGYRYALARQQMFAIYGTVCVHCGHPGAGEADHITPVKHDPHQPIDPALMRPSHGSNAPCPTCLRKCNQERGSRLNYVQYRPAIDW